MQDHPYLKNKRPLVLAHRGSTPPSENTLQAFQNAEKLGATYFETDVRTTLDGVAVLAHDENLLRVFGDKRKVAELKFSDFKRLEPSQGGTTLGLEELLNEFPKARINIDIKESRAIAATVSVIEKLGAHDRVLVSSFSNSRRKKALHLFSKPVATSGSASTALKCYLLTLLSVRLDKSLSGVGALQLPQRLYGLKFNSPRFINAVHRTGTQIHFWTINSEIEITKLLKLGANGIVTDNVKLAIAVVDKNNI